jgi:hypothetical protein
MYGGWFMPYNTPNESAWCCTGSGFENHAKYGDSIYWHDDDGIFVNLFIASELTWRDKSVTIRQETRYPEGDSTALVLHCAQPITMAIRIRYPGWAQDGMEIQVNGQPFAHDARPGTYITISRTWKTADRIDVRLPMRLRLEPMPDNRSRAAVCYGPLVLAGQLGTEGIEPPMPYAIMQRDFFVFGPPPMPVLLAGNRPVEDWVKPVPGEPLTFWTEGVGRPKDVTLVAFYTMPPQRYSLYWDILTDEQWQEYDTVEQRFARRDAQLAERTYDSVKIGDIESETRHNIRGKNTCGGMLLGRSYREAGHGDVFSYDLNVPSGIPVKLLCTYWGSQSGPRTFDILVNRNRIGTETLNRNRPGEFFDVEYDIPAEASADRSRVTVTFQAKPGPVAIAGPLFDLRVLTSETQ